MTSRSSPPEPIIAAMTVPPFGPGCRSMAWYEDFLLSNVRIFARGGIRAVKVKDETREEGDAAEQTIARMSALGRAFRKEYPQLQLGLNLQAHDARAPLAIADAVDAHFVRMKIFVGQAVNAEGKRNGLGVAATRYRAQIGRTDTKIYADVHDRTAVPLAPVPNETAALWAQSLGADCLVITGSDFQDTLSRIEAARGAGVKRPIVIGGGVSEGNIAQALSVADSVIVSTSLMRGGAAYDDMNLWDEEKVRRLVDAGGSR